MKYYKNTITGAISYTIPVDFNVKGLWQTFDDSNSKTTSSSGTKSSWTDTFGAVVSSLSTNIPTLLSAFGIGNQDKKVDNKVTTAAGSAGSSPVGGSGSGSAGSGSGKDNGSSFNWTTLLLPVIGIVVIVLLITKK